MALPRRSLEDVAALLVQARAAGRLQTARKTRAVDARPARPGEVVVTTIKDQGKETRSRPAEEGDWVVRNRCPETGNEQYLVAARVFSERYGQGGPPAADGWQEFHPIGKDVRVLIVGTDDGSFAFTAPWGELMVAHPGDALVQDPDDERDIYRVARASFLCTYEVVG
jgi:hypothetical protein